MPFDKKSPEINQINSYVIQKIQYIIKKQKIIHVQRSIFVSALRNDFCYYYYYYYYYYWGV